ncbi:MAG: hypothetical protein Q8P41_04005 [Pseudomonadota bacterium]|nr:hypothetical protein [Pseudomonadota bacterium]
MALTQVALVLPFVTAKGCDNGVVTDYTGVGLYLSANGMIVLLPMAVVTALLLAFPYRGAPISRALAPGALTAFGAAVGLLLALVGPSFALLFDELTYRVGWYLHVSGWAALYAASLVGSVIVLARGGGARLQGREAVAIGVLAIAPPLAVLVNVLHNELAPAEVIGSFAVGYGMVVPLILAGVGILRQRADGALTRPTQVSWWLLVVLTLAGHTIGAVSD